MSNLKANRSISRMLRLFKFSSWLMLFLLIIAGIFASVLIIINPSNPLIIVLAVIIIMISVLTEIVPENYFFNSTEREKELIEKKQIYKKYLDEIDGILKGNDINEPKQVKKLKEECEAILKAHENNFLKMNSKVIDMLIGIPLRALFVSIIYVNSSTVVTSIIALVIVGFMGLGVIRLIKIIIYYSEGYFKDVHLLNILNEWYYSKYNTQD